MPVVLGAVTGGPIQTALPWGSEASAGDSPSRRRELELAERLRQAVRSIYRLRRTLGDRDQEIAGLRQDLAELAAERDHLARELSGVGCRRPVVDVEGGPRGPGWRAALR